MLQSLPVPESAWQVISLDFAEGLPLSDNYNCVLVVVDLLTKYNHFIPLRHPFTMVRVAKAFFHSVYHLHGLPSAIISDRDRIFTSHFCTELFKLGDVKLCRSTVYHPQSDGQTERLNQCLELIYAVMSMLAQKSGVSGCLRLSSGITPVTIQLLADLLLRPCMVIPHVCWPLILHRHPTLKSLLGHLTDSGWINSYSSICIVLSTA